MSGISGETINEESNMNQIENALIFAKHCIEDAREGLNIVDDLEKPALDEIIADGTIEEIDKALKLLGVE